MKHAREAFARGSRLMRESRTEEALAEFRRASELAPRSAQFATVRELAKQQLVLEHIRRGNKYEAEQRAIPAMAEFQAALALDPANSYVLERIRASSDAGAPPRPPALLRVEDSGEVDLKPQAGVRSIHFRGDTRGLWTEIGRVFGLTVTFDDTTPAVPVRFNVDEADFESAAAAAQRVTRTFYVPLAERAIIVLPDNAGTRNAMERSVMRTFYVEGLNSAQELNDYVNVLRVIFDLSKITISSQNFAVTVRGTQAQVDAASRFMQEAVGGPPQVLLDTKFYEVSNSTLKDIGIDLPLQFQLIYLTGLALPGGTNLQDLINQLFATGAINQANSQAIQALLAQLQNQQASIFQNPIATFGGGITFFGVSVPPATIRAAFNESNVSNLEHLTLRAGNNTAVTMRVGSRFPILNATFSPIFNTASVSQVLANNSFQAPFPSFSYEDLGVTLKATPIIQSDRDVTLKLEMQIRALTGQNINGIPVISNREYTGTITVPNGDTAILAGLLTESDQKSLRGLPGLTSMLGPAVSSSQRTKNYGELLITITPHIVASRPQSSATFVMGR